MGSKLNDKCPRGKRRRQRRIETREDRGRDLSYAAISQEMPGNAGKEKVGFPPRVQRKNGPADISILDCWPPEPQENKFLFSATKLVVVCYNSRKTQVEYLYIDFLSGDK